MSAKGQNLKQKRVRDNNLVEVLRGFGSDTTKGLSEDFLGKIPKDIFEQFGLHPRAGSDNSRPSEQTFFEEREELQRRLRQGEVRRREERVVFTAKEQETKTKVAILLEEVKKLASSIQTLEQKVEVAAVQAPVEPGIYHINFFEKLISFIRSLSQKVEDASLWVASSNTKARKRSFYWGQVQKSGSKFMLSQERYMATQAG
jgi:hypothetical protein